MLGLRIWRAVVGFREASGIATETAIQAYNATIASSMLLALRGSLIKSLG